MRAWSFLWDLQPTELIWVKQQWWKKQHLADQSHVRVNLAAPLLANHITPVADLSSWSTG